MKDVLTEDKQLMLDAFLHRGERKLWGYEVRWEWSVESCQGYRKGLVALWLLRLEVVER